MSRLYCSYFDHRYLPRGLAMIRSLRRHEPDAQVWVLCLSNQAEKILEAMAEPGVRPLALAELEAGDTALATAKADGRGTVEYYFTLTPSLVRYVLNHAPGADIVTYLDGDLWFADSPEAIYREMGEASVVIIPHHFKPSMRHQEKFGVYNVGWLSFRNDARGRACLEWWRDRTNEWCFDRPEPGRYCEQAYLDQFPKLFQGVRVLANRGANLAPWNVDSSRISLRDGNVRANNDRVIFFHFHGIKQLGPRKFLPIHAAYGTSLSGIVRERLYRPYLEEFLAIKNEVEARFGALDQSVIRKTVHGDQDFLWVATKSMVKLWLATWRRHIVVVD